MLELVVVLGTATLATVLFHIVHLPPLLGFISTGIIVGPYGLGLVSSPLQVETMTEIAAVLLMFTIGLEFSFKKLTQYRKLLLGVGIPQVLFTIGATFLFLRLFTDVSFSQALFVGFLISLSSTAVVYRLLRDNREMDSLCGKGVLSTLVVQDLAVIPMLLALPLIGHASGSFEWSGWYPIFLFLTKLLACLAYVWFGSKYFIPFLLDRVAGTRSRELFFFSILFVCVGSAYLMNGVGLSLSLGAFVAGMMISDSTYGKQAMVDFIPFRDNFLGFFFVTVGMLFDIGFFVENLASIIGLLFAVIALKFLIVYFVFLFNRMIGAVAVASGLLLSQVGEFSLILADFGMKFNLLSDEQMKTFISISVLSLAATPVISRASSRFLGRFSFSELIRQGLAVTKKIKTNSKEAQSGHTIIIGYGVAGQNAAMALKSIKVPYTVIEMNNETVKRFQKTEKIFFGDASNKEILREAGLSTAHLVIITVPSVRMIDSTLRSIHDLRPDLKVIVRAHYLRELDSIKRSERFDFVVAEYETTLEIVAKTLAEYGASPFDVHQFLDAARRNLSDTTQALSESLRNRMDLPGWELFSKVKPIRLQAEDYAVGKTLGELNLRQISGALVISVFRESFGNAQPGPDFQFEVGDVLYLMGNAEQSEMAEKLLRAKKNQPEEAPRLV